jgi:ankyrin repeat protein
MPTRSLPRRPSLDQLKIQASALRRAHRDGKKAAAARIAAHHPKSNGQSVTSILARRLTVAAAQLVIAREYGFESWARLKHHVDFSQRLAKFKPHPRFHEAVAALDAGDVEGLRRLLAADPSLVQARTNLEPPYGYFSAATVLHHVAGNPGPNRDSSTPREPLPNNVVNIARVLLDAGADVNASTIGPNGGTTMGLVVTSLQASNLGVSGPLMQLLLDRGAKPFNLKDPAVLDPSLINHAPRAAEKLIELGANADVLAAAALGRMVLLRACFDDRGRLRSRPRRRGTAMSERDAIGLALLLAYVRGQPRAVDFLLEKDGNWNMIGVNNGTALHRAAWDGDLPMIERLVAKGADVNNRDNPFLGTPIGWAHYNKQAETVRWMAANCALDIHEAVGFGLRDQVEARLREDPRSVNRRIDLMTLPRATPLFLAALYDREDVARLLLDKRANPNVIAGNGQTPLDVAEEHDVPVVARLIRKRGGKRAADL